MDHIYDMFMSLVLKKVLNYFLLHCNFITNKIYVFIYLQLKSCHCTIINIQSITNIQKKLNLVMWQLYD